MTAWDYIVLGISLFLLGWLLWMELRQPDVRPRPGAQTVRRRAGRRWMLRVVAVVLAVSSLACLALSLTYKRPLTASAGKEGILLTEGYDPDSLREFAGKNRDKEILEWKDGGINGSLAGLSVLHVFGYGLTRGQWAALHAPPLVFHPAAGTAGLIAVDWKKRPGPGKPLRVQGRWLSAAGRDPRRTKIQLTGMGDVLDSVIIGRAEVGRAEVGRAPKTEGRQRSDGEGRQRSDGEGRQGSDGEGRQGSDGEADTNFVLSTIPSQVGRSVYHLVAVTGSDTVEREDIPVEVVPGKTLKILLLAASPDFENTFLMNWLSKGGHAVARRTTVSREKYDRAFVNMAEQALSPLSASLLDHFDVVMADQSVLSSFGAGELSALRREVEEKGMGLILMLDRSGKAGIQGMVEVVMSKDSSQRLFIKEKEGLRVVLRDSLSRIMAGVGLYGAGKIVFTTGNTTYSQVLSGGGKQYAAYWSELLRTVARETEPEEEWRMEPALPAVGEPVRAWLQTAAEGLPQGYFGGAGKKGETIDGAGRTVYLAQDLLLPFYWQGVYWPEEAGWQYVRSLSGEPFWWYVWRDGEWVSLRRQERCKATQEYIAEVGRAEVGRSDGLAGVGAEQVPVPKGWFYVVFLLCVLFLWAERKMEWMNGRIVR